MATSADAARLLPPYPLPPGAEVPPDEEVHLELAGRLERRGLEAAAELGVGVGIGTNRLLVSGQMASLRTWADRLDAVGRLDHAETLRAALLALGQPPPALRLAGRDWQFGQRTYVMGIVNVTPDSFSGDGVGASPQAALERARRLQEEGADVLDLGGESTRPGHRPVSPAEELGRVLPALARIVAELELPVFVDTSKPEVAEAALAEGASAVNDVWGLRRHPGMAEAVATAGVPVVCMHNQEGHAYSDLLGEVAQQLRSSLALAQRAGIAPSQVILDPGLGFGKLHHHNLELLRRLPELRLLGSSLLVGPSRKSLIGWLLGDRPAAERVLGTAATVAWAVARGADWVRVHDVAQMRDVVRVTDALARPGAPAPA
ncbi:MAG: dihydropteroate synthase [Candidatus Dormibacteria bacterium]